MAKIKKNHKGSKNPMAILNETQIAIIRQLYKDGSYKQITLAATFSVHQSTISRIVRRKRWN